MTRIPRGTVRDWISGRIPRPATGAPAEPCPGCALHEELVDRDFAAYSYLLGLYLGDGCISAGRRGVFRLRVTLDRSYPGIVEECLEAMRRIVPSGRASVYSRPTDRVDEVSAFSKHWPCLIPQHGPGRKHERDIELKEWQREVLDGHPWRFLRGLVHSDGSRFTNVIRHPNRVYRYPRYNFTNHSDDIRDLFCEYCDKVGVRWRQMNRWNISVARCESVARMDRFVGPKV